MRVYLFERGVIIKVFGCVEGWFLLVFGCGECLGLGLFVIDLVMRVSVVKVFLRFIFLRSYLLEYKFRFMML